MMDILLTISLLEKELTDELMATTTLGFGKMEKNMEMVF